MSWNYIIIASIALIIMTLYTIVKIKQQRFIDFAISNGCRAAYDNICVNKQFNYVIDIDPYFNYGVRIGDKIAIVGSISHKIIKVVDIEAKIINRYYYEECDDNSLDDKQWGLNRIF